MSVQPPCTEDIIFLDGKENQHIDTRIEGAYDKGKLIDIRDFRKNIENYTINGKKISETKKIFTSVMAGRTSSKHEAIFKKYVASHITDPHVLDVGCGQAVNVENWVDLCGKYMGVDLTLGQLEIARKYLPRDKFPNVFLYFGTANSSGFEKNSMDFVISSEIIEHLDDPQGHINYLASCLKPEGILSLSTPNGSLNWEPGFMIPMLIFHPVKWYKGLNCHLYWEEALAWHPALPPKILKRMLENAGLQVEEHLTCVWFTENPVRIVMRISELFEKFGFKFHLLFVRKWFQFLESLLEKLPKNLKIMFGIRQIIVGRKHSESQV